MKRWLIALCAGWALSAFAATEVNTAGEAELDSIKGLGPAGTALILQARTQGPFTSWKDLMVRVKGIKAAKAQQLSDNGLTVNGKTLRNERAAP